MDAETRFAYRVGIVVICAAIILAILLTLFGETWTSQYTIVVRTATAPNVSKNTPVRRNGIRIGRVADVVNEGQEVQLYLKIDSGQPVFKNEVCEIGTASLLGDAVIDFMPGPRPILGEKLEDGDSVDPMDVVIERSPVEMIEVVMDLQGQVDRALDSITSTSDEINTLTKQAQDIAGGIADVMGGENSGIQEFLMETNALAAEIKMMAGNISAVSNIVSGLLDGPQVAESFNDTIIQLPGLIADFGRTVNDARDTLNSFKGASESAKANLNNLESFTAALGTNGPNALASLEKSLLTIDSFLADFDALAGDEKAQGTIGKLLTDPELYNNLNATVRNAREISDQLKPIIIQLQPLMNDVRYAVDGIARDPGQLGVRGALNRGQPFGQFKGTIAPKPQFR